MRLNYALYLRSVLTMRKFLTYLVCLASMSGLNASMAQQFQSGPSQVTLVELYTSQGCSSCPPAEEYLNSLKNHGELWKNFVPVALHVDYWDYIGWKDRFASPQHTLRQRQYALVNRQRAIYTPAFFVNGRPWRRSFFNSVPSSSNVQTGTLRIALVDDQIDARFIPQDAAGTEQLSLTVCIVGMGLKTHIKAGENEGRSSRHDFVKLNGVSVLSSDNQWRFRLPPTNSIKAEQYALVAWVSKKGDPRPLQTVGGYIR